VFYPRIQISPPRPLPPKFEFKITPGGTFCMPQKDCQYYDTTVEVRPSLFELSMMMPYLVMFNGTGVEADILTSGVS
jgi:hypothetical protein